MGPLTRTSITLQNLRIGSKDDRQAWILNHINELPGTGIIYTLTRRDAESVSMFLQKCGVNTKAYHSSIEHADFLNSGEYRKHLEDLLLHNSVKALVATSALGMGYDKPDLGFVVHYQAPGSVIGYYQQVGRAGRAIDHAIGVLMTGTEDGDIQEYFRTSSFPKPDDVYAILDALSDADGLAVRDLETRINLPNRRIEHVLKYLSVEMPSPVIKDGNFWKRTATDYVLDEEKIQRLTNQRIQEWREIQEYVSEQGCFNEVSRKLAR